MLISLALCLAPTCQEPTLPRPSAPEVRRGWLLESQGPDGRWDADAFPGHDLEGAGPGRPGDDVLATSLALWACLGDGRGLGEGPDADAMARGVRWLLGRQDLETGWIRDAPHAAELRQHALATAVLCDFLALHPGPLLRDGCERAVGALARTQAPTGSWEDVRTTAWALFAYAAAGAAGIDVSAESVARGAAWLRTARDEEGLLRGADGDVDVVATGLDVLRELAALPPDDDRSEAATRGARLLTELARPERERDGETWFVSAATALRIGGPTWKDLQPRLREEVLDTQERGGALHGSWDPRGAPGGRVVETSWNALTLEVYFRYARVFPAR